MTRASGYSLFELMVVISLVALGFVVAVPSYQSLVQKNRVNVAVNQLVSALNYARQEAIIQHKVVSLCASHDGQQCGGDWSEGMLLFTDTKARGYYQAEDSKLHVYPALPVNTRLLWNRSENLIQMSPTGYLLKSQNGTFTYCIGQTQPRAVRLIVVSLTGRVRVIAIADKKCSA